MDLDTQRIGTLVAVGAVVLALLAGGLVLWWPASGGVLSPPADGALVTVRDADTDRRLGQVRATVADTFSERYTGLSDTESLGPNEGMLFVYRSESERAFVMRSMGFPLDMVFIGADRRITAIHHAPLPPPNTTEANLTRYRGQAKWVLEVNQGWTTAHDVEIGDRVRIEYGANLTMTDPATSGNAAGAIGLSEGGTVLAPDR